jgi:formylglycine-generating enzyme
VATVVPVQIPAPEPELKPIEPCPAEMVLVDTMFCPEVRQTCLKSHFNGPNHLTVCEEFAADRKCLAAERRERFCIDRYEFPSEPGGHPPVMVSAYDAAGLCAERGKRLCWESEWTAACEGPEPQPFPYGLKRDHDRCNIDNPYLKPDLDKVHDPRDEIRGPELLRLDQSAPSGAMAGCVSGFGVHDLTGNFDEWVRTESIRGEGKWAGLKGGAWGAVRNACRPITTKHVPQWSYYFVSFRCCRDAATGEPWPQPDIPLPSHPAGKPLDHGWTPPPGAARPHARQP